MTDSNHHYCYFQPIHWHPTAITTTVNINPFTDDQQQSPLLLLSIHSLTTNSNHHYCYFQPIHWWPTAITTTATFNPFTDTQQQSPLLLISTHSLTTNSNHHYCYFQSIHWIPIFVTCPFFWEHLAMAFACACTEFSEKASCDRNGNSVNNEQPPEWASTRNQAWMLF